MFSGYREITVLWDINLMVNEREALVVLGANGSGKSTLLYTVAGVLKPFKGAIVFMDKDVSKDPAKKRVEYGMALVPEGRHLFPQMTVYENLEVAGLATKRGQKYFAESLELVYNLFPRLKERKDQKAGTLSGGEQQMLTIARALMCKPSILLLDEPSQGLAPKVIDEVYDALFKLKEEETITLIIAEQQLTNAIERANRTVVLDKGRIVYDGEPQTIIGDLKKIYVG